MGSFTKITMYKTGKENVIEISSKLVFIIWIVYNLFGPFATSR